MREVEKLGYDYDTQTLPVGAMLSDEYSPQRLPFEQ